MINLIARFHNRTLNTTNTRDERGSVSVEQVIITVALITVGLLVAAAITAAVNNRIGGII